MKTEVIMCSIWFSYSVILQIPRNVSASSKKILFLKNTKPPYSGHHSIVDTFEKSEGCPL